MIMAGRDREELLNMVLLDDVSVEEKKEREERRGSKSL
jgi:hypothetical protein